MNTNYGKIKEAIINKQQIIARYKGHLRYLCPHVLGKSPEGLYQLLAYQFAGTSSTKAINPNRNSPDNWRCMQVAELIIVEIKDGNWYTCDKHTRPQVCVKTIDVEVDY